MSKSLVKGVKDYFELYKNLLHLERFGRYSWSQVIKHKVWVILYDSYNNMMLAEEKFLLVMKIQKLPFCSREISFGSVDIILFRSISI